jgi:hypothetical protein
MASGYDATCVLWECGVQRGVLVRVFFCGRGLGLGEVLYVMVGNENGR